MDLPIAQSGNAYVLEAVRVAGHLEGTVFEDCVIVFEDGCHADRCVMTRSLLYQRGEGGAIRLFNLGTVIATPSQHEALQKGIGGGVVPGERYWPQEKLDHLQSLTPFSLRDPSKPAP